MKERPADSCVHRIVSFQAHRGCHQLAAICEKGCQEPHLTDQDRQIISVEAVEEQFTSIKRLFKEVKSLSSSIADLYNKINDELHEQQVKHLKEIQQELQGELMKQICLQKSIVEKLDNKRYERVNCNELMTFLEFSNVQQKIQRDLLSAISNKHLTNIHRFKNQLHRLLRTLQEPNNPKAHLQQESSPSEQEWSPERKPRKNIGIMFEPRHSNHRVGLESNEEGRVKIWQQKVREGEKVNAELRQQLGKMRYHYKVLQTQKRNLERELSKKTCKHLSLRTWNMLKIMTKKIKKDPKASTLQDSGKRNDINLVQTTHMPSIAQTLRSPMEEDHPSKGNPQILIEEEEVIPEQSFAREQIRNDLQAQLQENCEQAVPAENNRGRKDNADLEKERELQHWIEVDRVVGSAPAASSALDLEKGSQEGPLAILDVGKQSGRREEEEKRDSSDIFSFFRRKIF